MKKHFVDATTTFAGCRQQAKGTAVDDLCPCVCVCVGCQSCSWANGAYAQPRVDTSCGQAKDNMGHRPSYFFLFISLYSKSSWRAYFACPFECPCCTQLSQFFLRSPLFFSLHRFSHLPGPGQLLSSALVSQLARFIPLLCFSSDY